MGKSEESRYNAQLTKSKGRIQDVYDFFNNNLFLKVQATVKSYDSIKKIVTCNVLNSKFANLDIEAPVTENWIDFHLQGGMQIWISQVVRDPLNLDSENFFDRGNWILHSVVNPTVITIGGANGIEISTSGVKIAGKDWATHVHSDGAYTAPNGKVTGTSGGVV